MAASSSSSIQFSEERALSLFTSKTHSKYATLATVNQISSLLTLLSADATVPFIVRYRVPQIGSSLSTNPDVVHKIRESHSSHSNLRTTRQKIVSAMMSAHPPVSQSAFDVVLASSSPSELDDIYKPLKPATKGSLAARAIEKYDVSHNITKVIARIMKGEKVDVSNDKDYRAAVVTLVASEINKSVPAANFLKDQIDRFGTIVTSEAKMTEAMKKKMSSAELAQADKHRPALSTYTNFSKSIGRLNDFQTLAIRRGVVLNVLNMKIDVGEGGDDRLKQGLFRVVFRNQQPEALLTDAVDDVYSRLLKKRVCNSIWRDKVATAEVAGVATFSTNYKQMMLTPPLAQPMKVFAIDPGFAACKVASLDQAGAVIRMVSVDWRKDKVEAIRAMGEMLSLVKSTNPRVLCALGTGTASSECRQLVETAAQSASVDIDVKLINEDGASVWSASSNAQREFPNPKGGIAVLGAVCIGRKLQDPMGALVSIPPKSLGLGMYQHDLNEAQLEAALDFVAIDCIAEVGVDVNTCSVDLLRRVPGLTRKNLAENVIEGRPYDSRADLKRAKGVGPKAYENCAGFCRIKGGKNPLDETSLHPDDYLVAKKLMKNMDLGESDLGVEAREIDRIKTSLERGSKDPRLLRREDSETKASKWRTISSVDFGNLESLAAATPIYGIAGCIKNIVPFGAFVDIGLKNDGLLHISKMKNRSTDGLFAGDAIAVDIMEVDAARRRVSLAVAVTGRVSHGEKRKRADDDNNVKQKKTKT